MPRFGLRFEVRAGSRRVVCASPSFFQILAVRQSAYTLPQSVVSILAVLMAFRGEAAAVWAALPFSRARVEGIAVFPLGLTTVGREEDASVTRLCAAGGTKKGDDDRERCGLWPQAKKKAADRGSINTYIHSSSGRADSSLNYCAQSST